MAYVTDQELTRYVGSEIQADAEFITAARLAAEEAVNAYCGRSFDAASTATNVYAVRPCQRVVTIHDIIDTTGITVTDDGSTVAAADIQLEPLNGKRWTGEAAAPYYRIRRLGSYWTHSADGEATLSITSTRWGWASIPDAVVEATKILAKDVLHVRVNRFGVAGFGEFGVVRVRDNPHVAMLLKGLRHPWANGIA